MLKPTLSIAIALVAAALVLVSGLSGSATAARHACATQVYQNGLDVVFGRANTQAKADAITARAQRVGFSPSNRKRDEPE